MQSVSETLSAVANMKRLLEAYRSLAPLTIGGPSSTSLETQGQPQVPGRPPSDPRFIKKFAPYPFLMGPVFPPPGLQSQTVPPGHLMNKVASSDNSRASPAPPIFSPRDKESSSLRETLLDGQTISCFNVGGEDRLCLTQLLQLVLHAIPLPRIHQACDELQIFCSTCTPIQLAQLKFARVLPLSAAQCGLITKSDGERLCSLLLQEPSQRSASPSSPPPPPSSPAVSPPRGDPTSFKVQHQCFGDCIGVLHPQSYSSPGAKCIECTECQSYLSPQKFVSHSHSKQENRTCHWGFDSANWTTYIQVFEDYSEEEQEKYKEELESIKKRFSHMKLKRKWIDTEREEYNKRSRPDDDQQNNIRSGMLEHQHVGPGIRVPLDLSSSQFHDQPHQQMPLNHVFLNPMNIPFHGAEKTPAPPQVGQFPMLDPRPLQYLQWATNPLANPYLAGMRGPGPVASPVPPPYLHSLAQFHSLKTLQQNLAKSLLQASHNTPHNYENLLRNSNKKSDDSQPTPAAPMSGSCTNPEEGPQLSEFVVSVSAVLETTGVDHAAKSRVMNVVNRLVDRLHKTQEEKDSARLQLKGMEERVAKLEKELEDRSIVKGEDHHEPPLYESSSDAGIESGTEADDCLSEK